MNKNINYLTIDLMRHGKSKHNILNKYSNSLYDELDYTAYQDIERLKETISANNYTRAISSPYKRCIETAKGMIKDCPVEIEIENTIKEMSLGVWDGMTPYEIEKEYNKEWKIWNNQPEKLKMKDREDLQQLRKRVIPWFENIIHENEDGHYLIVTHVAIIRTILVYYLNIPLSNFRSIDIPYLNMYRIEIINKKKPVFWELTKIIV
jgi:broad specificity phosphatase PhoE